MTRANIGNIAGMYVQSGVIDTSDVTVFTTGIPETDADNDGIPELTAEQQTDLDDFATTQLDLGTWLKVCVVNASRDGSRDEIDLSDRCSGESKAYVPGQAETSIDFEIFAKKIPTIPAWFTLLENADQYGGVISVLMLDDSRTKSGARGVIGNFNIFNFTETQNLNEGIQYSVTLKPSGMVTFDPPVRRVVRP